MFFGLLPSLGLNLSSLNYVLSFSKFELSNCFLSNFNIFVHKIFFLFLNIFLICINYLAVAQVGNSSSGFSNKKSYSDLEIYIVFYKLIFNKLNLDKNFNIYGFYSLVNLC